MKNNEIFQKDAHVAIRLASDTGTKEFSFISRVGKNLRKIFIIGSLAAMGLLVNGCATGYVDREPAYVEYNRPAQPSSLHVWVNGDYSYNHRSHVYVQKHGSWHKPNNNSTYAQGHWQSRPRRSYWVSGTWQRNY
jgi:hypothetical protein